MNSARTIRIRLVIGQPCNRLEDRTAGAAVVGEPPGENDTESLGSDLLDGSAPNQKRPTGRPSSSISICW